ncbi:hypothetical protein HWV62_37591 [Athelia sp. TMB]|nr:hypothetical protein HWV62_37591 [Athelia sp. TMB]
MPTVQGIYGKSQQTRPHELSFTPPSNMARLSFLALFAVALAGIAKANPIEERGLWQAQVPVHTTESWDYTDCGSPTDPIQIQSIEVSPDPPQPGKDLTVKVKATVLERIEEGAWVDVTVKLGLIKILHKQFDLCEEARNAHASIQCPAEPGDYEVSQTVTLPKEIPPGTLLSLSGLQSLVTPLLLAKFNIDVRGYTVDDDDLVCLRLKADFIKRQSGIAW